VAVRKHSATATGAHVVVARVGGEEFLVAEAVAHDGGIDERAERLRSAVASLPWNVTASVGVACAACTSDGATRSIVGDIVAAADAAMYAAKRNGGNQTRSATTIH
jgi:diguanylate cyclase (GGDEF)-like protein